MANFVHCSVQELLPVCFIGEIEKILVSIETHIEYEITK